ncbi:hypothetical protein MMC17_002632 [Xylographa soralifera]|nr:hypothetical protein [Xylographa soralifera]
MPFPEFPLRGPGRLIIFSNREEEILYPEVLRRFRKIRLTFLVGSADDAEPYSRDEDYCGHMCGYTSSEMNGGIKGFKQVLGALAADLDLDGEVEEPYSLQSRVRGLLYLDLKWPNPVRIKRATADDFAEHWKKQGIWDKLVRVEKVRRIEFGGTAYAAFGPERIPPTRFCIELWAMCLTNIFARQFNYINPAPPLLFFFPPQHPVASSCRLPQQNDPFPISHHPV